MLPFPHFVSTIGKQRFSFPSRRTLRAIKLCRLSTITQTTSTFLRENKRSLNRNRSWSIRKTSKVSKLILWRCQSVRLCLYDIYLPFSRVVRPVYQTYLVSARVIKFLPVHSICQKLKGKMRLKNLYINSLLNVKRKYSSILVKILLGTSTFDFLSARNVTFALLCF